MSLKVKTISSWLMLSAVVVMLIFAVTASLLVSNKTYAEGELQIEHINHNAYYKVVYQNLKKCYAEMKSPLTESSTNTWASFDSGTFFSDVALEDSFLKFPYNTVASKDQASCPGMIMGWHTNWFVNIFTGNGSYDGLLELNQNASVPDGSWNSNVDNYSTFLKNIGYTENSDNSALANAKCFYVSMEITEDFYDMYWGPVAGTKFETQDFCVNLSGNSDIVNHGSTFYLKGKNDYFGEEYDEGHLDDDVNVAYVFFKQGDLVPKYYVGLRTGDTVLDATLDYYFLNYKYYNSTVGEYQRDALTYISPDTVSTKKNAVDNDYCWGLGYYKCGYEDKGFLYTTWYWGTLMPQNGLISFNDFKTKLTKVIAQTQSDGAYWFDNVRSVEYKPTTNTYTKSNDSSKFINYFLLNTDNYDDGKFNEAEKYMLYYTYLKDYYNVSTRADAVDGGVKVSWLNDDNKTFSDVYVYNPKQNSSELQYILDNSDKWDGASTADWYNIALLLAEINTEDAFEGAETVDPVIDPDLGEQEDPESGAVSEGDPCYNSGIEGMSWILCPAINNMASAVDGIDGMLDDWLSVDTNLYDNNSQAREAWTYFRDIANIIIIVILVVVIFSQITGFGIDNYGIKRILPRLIAMAILINLSFIICQIAIDVSNILGVGLNNMFQSIGRTIYGGLTPGEVVETIVTALFAAIVGIGAASGAIITVASLAVSGGGIMLVISLVLVLLVALVAVMMFFIMLGARMVIVVIFTAIAPIAFACYVLPNTQSLFKKWWDIFKAALVVYPICGALYGMSFIIRGTVFSGGEVQFWMAIIAICAPFLPFLLLPTLLRGALSALGRVGGAVAAVGAGIRGGVRKGNQSLQNTAAYKNAQEQSRRNMTRWSAGLDRNGNRRENIGRFGRFLRGGTRGMAQARAQYRKDIETQGMEDSLMGAGFDSAVANAESNVESRRVADYQSLLDLGRARDNDGNVVNTNDAESVSRYHREALGRYRSARSADEQRQAMAQVKAAQNILSKTDKGRAGIQRNFEQAIRDGSTVGLSEAAGHLMGEYGDKYKSVNRGAHAMLSDLSTMDLSNENNVRTIQSRLDTIDNNGSIVQSGSYSMKGTDKYTEESLAGADDIALDRMIESIKNNSLTGSDLMDIQSTARRALAKSESGNLNIKPEVQRKLESIINGNNGGNSTSADNEITITHSE